MKKIIFYINNEKINVRKCKQPTFNNSRKRIYISIIILIDNEKIDGYIDKYLGKYIYFNYNKNWYKFNILNILSDEVLNDIFINNNLEWDIKLFNDIRLYTVFSSIPKDSWGIHSSHCCFKHGCKYGYNDCPVELGLIKQEYPCEYCSYDDKHTNEIKRILLKYNSYSDSCSDINIKKENLDYLLNELVSINII